MLFYRYRQFQDYSCLFFIGRRHAGTHDMCSGHKEVFFSAGWPKDGIGMRQEVGMYFRHGSIMLKRQRLRDSAKKVNKV